MVSNTPNSRISTIMIPTIKTPGSIFGIAIAMFPIFNAARESNYRRKYFRTRAAK